MKHLNKINRADWGLVPTNPDPNFDPAHNARVIEETIRINDEKRAQDMKQFNDRVAERTEAAAMFLKNLDHGQGVSDVSKYFGKTELARLRGEHIISKLRENISFRDSKGRIVKRAGDV